MKEHFTEQVKCKLIFELWIGFISVECREKGVLREEHDGEKCVEGKTKRLLEKQVIHFFSQLSM